MTRGTKVAAVCVAVWSTVLCAPAVCLNPAAQKQERDKPHQPMQIDVHAEEPGKRYCCNSAR